VNAPVLRLFGVVVLLFGVLVVFTSRWTVFDAESLRDNPKNRRALLEEQKIHRGVIRSADGKLLARSVRGEGGTYSRRYPTGSLFSAVVGYSYTDLGRAGIEKQRDDLLTGRRTELVTAIQSILGRSKDGDEVRTTLDAGAQKVAFDALRASGHAGAVVALDVRSGAVKVMATEPTYDAATLDEPGVYKRLASDDARGALLNRATQSVYPPGSTMKVVTATAALDTGRYEPGSRVSGKNGKPISGVPLNNFGGEDYGDIDLTFALTNSVNTVWAEVGEKLGRRIMNRYMERYGFDEKPDLDYPSGQMTASGVRKDGDLVQPTDDRVDIGRMAIGQGDLLATPLQMAEVAQTVANGGVRMKPYLMDRAIDPDGQVVEETEPTSAGRVMSTDTARKLTAMMKRVVDEGTGTAAALSGVDVAGKTGTAELNLTGLNQPWFIGFTPKIAVAVTLERVQGGQGGVVAAPIAKQVLEALGG
jgi:peptidoglycan glycosyltransferase